MNLTEKIKEVEERCRQAVEAKRHLTAIIAKALTAYLLKHGKVLPLEDMTLFYQNLNGKESIHVHDDLGTRTVYDEDRHNNDAFLNLYKHSPILQEKLEDELDAIIADI